MSSPSQPPQLAREISLREATALNMIDMIGVGPFITLPLIVHAMGGPQAMLGWILGAFFAMCDGQVWAELGASMPQAGGSYQYLRQSFGPGKLGRLMSFLFVWQLIFSAPLSIASGCLGVAQYASYLWPALGKAYFDHPISVMLPLVGKFEVRALITNGTFVAMAVCVLALFLLYRRITVIGRLSKFLWVGVIGTMLWVIFAGLTHFSAARAFSFPPNAFHFSTGFMTGLGSAMLIAYYDYWGYYNVCFLGAEVRQPERNIPRAVLWSIAIVAVLYLLMNVSMLGVVPWQEMDHVAMSGTQSFVASTLLQRTYGAWAGNTAAVLIMWVAFASVFSLLLGYSRVPYAAARDGNFFRPYANVHPKGQFPYVSLLTLGGVAALFCMFRLIDVIIGLVVIRITIQFLMQIVGLLLLRARRPNFPRPFRMWLYPLPAVLALMGFVYVLFARRGSLRDVSYALVIVVIGLLIFLTRSWRRKEWPFAAASQP
ncbi:MAG TPA: APC family permease [Verrucomicrobiae bacterium]|jgi:APA family basic amino acid/polyamine antiporter|nr:APC family permease [Verrucomicrobiae bacterium]